MNSSVDCHSTPADPPEVRYFTNWWQKSGFLLIWGVWCDGMHLPVYPSFWIGQMRSPRGTTPKPNPSPSAPKSNLEPNSWFRLWSQDFSVDGGHAGVPCWLWGLPQHRAYRHQLALVVQVGGWQEPRQPKERSGSDVESGACGGWGSTGVIIQLMVNLLELDVSKKGGCHSC